jgi:hypothetical protein
MTNVGRCSFSISHAVVADLPVPVAPSRTVSREPADTRRASSSIAAGWSPEGSKSETTSKGARLGLMEVTVLTASERTPTLRHFPFPRSRTATKAAELDDKCR